MAVMGVWTFILCTRHRWHIKQKNQNHENIYQADFLWTENKKVFCFSSFCVQYTKFWLEFGIVNIWTNCRFIWSGKVNIWLSVWEFIKLCLWQPWLNKLMHVENWNTDHLQHYLYELVFVSHACTQITINTFINDLVFFTVRIQYWWGYRIISNHESWSLWIHSSPQLHP